MVCFWDGFVPHWVYNSLQDEVFWVPRTGKPTIGLDELQEFTDPKWAGLRIITTIPPIQWSTDATWSIQKMFHAMYPLYPHIFLLRSFTRVTGKHYQDIPPQKNANHQFMSVHPLKTSSCCCKNQTFKNIGTPKYIGWEIPQFLTVKSSRFHWFSQQHQFFCGRYICLRY